MNHKVKFTGTGSTYASGGQGTLYLFVQSNEATNTPTIKLSYRIMYLDN